MTLSTSTKKAALPLAAINIVVLSAILALTPTTQPQGDDNTTQPRELTANAVAIDVASEPQPSEQNAEAFATLVSVLLPGQYNTNDGRSFAFNTDGTFSGWFDESFPNAYGLPYSVSQGGNPVSVTISSPAGKVVNYSVDIGTDGEIILINDGVQTTLVPKEVNK